MFSQRTIPARPAAALAVLAVLLVVALALAPAHAAAEPLASPFQISVVGDTDANAGPAFDATRATGAAYNPDADEYVVSWTQSPGSGPDDPFGVLARRLASGGTPAGDVTLIARNAHVFTPALAYNGTSQRYELGFAADIGSGRAVSLGMRSADLLVGGSWGSHPNASADGPDIDSFPSVAVAAGGASLVTWQRAHCYPCGAPTVLAQRLDASGTPAGDANFTVAAGASPDVAAGPGGGWLVVYLSGTDVDAVALGADGAALGAPVTLASGAGSAPAVAYDADRGEYLVVWQGEGAGGVLGRRLSGAGTPAGPAFTVSSDGLAPDVAYNHGAGDYLVAWTDTHQILGRHLTGDGSLVGTEAFAVSSSASRAYEPSIAANETSGESLVTWEQNDGSPDRQVWGRRIAAPAPGSPTVTPGVAGSGSLTRVVVTTYAKDRVAPKVRIAASGRRPLRRTLRSGIRVALRADEACAVRIRLVVDAATARRLHLRSRTIASARQGLRRGGSTVRLRFPASVQRRLRNAHALRAHIHIAAADAAGNPASASRGVTLG